MAMQSQDALIATQLTLKLTSVPKRPAILGGTVRSRLKLRPRRHCAVATCVSASTNPSWLPPPLHHARLADGVPMRGNLIRVGVGVSPFEFLSANAWVDQLNRLKLTARIKPFAALVLHRLPSHLRFTRQSRTWRNLWNQRAAKEAADVTPL